MGIVYVVWELIVIRTDDSAQLMEISIGEVEPKLMKEREKYRKKARRKERRREGGGEGSRKKDISWISTIPSFYLLFLPDNVLPIFHLIIYGVIYYTQLWKKRQKERKKIYDKILGEKKRKIEETEKKNEKKWGTGKGSKQANKNKKKKKND